MVYNMLTALILTLIPFSLGRVWPYNRYFSGRTDSGFFIPDTDQQATEDASKNRFNTWLHYVVENQDNDSTDSVGKLFYNNTVPKGILEIDSLFDYLELPEPQEAVEVFGPKPAIRPVLPSDEADELLKHLNFPIDKRCTIDRTKWWYRTYDGSCNWLKQDETDIGRVGTARTRDFNQHSFADGVSKPRDGPNARAVSNAFFKRKKKLYYEHTPLLLGLIEFIMHDVTYSYDSQTETIEVEIPDDETDFPAGTPPLQVRRTQAIDGTGVNGKPRENVNMATTWLDLSSLYGSTEEVAKALRLFEGGRLLTQEAKAPGSVTYASYLPYNSMNVSMNTRPGTDPTALFAGGDPRTNEDWLMLGVHTLLLREHNRLCGILAKQHPEYDDERLYQTIRLVMSAKYALIANSYQMTYWDKDMPWPRDDGFPLYRQMYGKDFLQINPMNTYPWPLVTKGGKPTVVSAEMALIYRFHEFIIPSFPIMNAKNETLWTQSTLASGFNATGFVDVGLENILRGTVGTHIPNFKSGVDESFRSNSYRGHSFDIATWSIVHEREQGLPTFNDYFRKYNSQKPLPYKPVMIRTAFENFTTDETMLENLKRLYKSPDDVDLVVGVQLDESNFPGTTVPTSALIISLFSLFGMGNSDRFSVGFAMTRCLLVQPPWNCKPTNALEELIWAPRPKPGFPNLRWLDSFWLTELDFQAHGANLLWRLITENTDIKCVQSRPLVPADPVTNPIICTLPKPSTKSIVSTVLSTILEVFLALYRQRAAFYTVIIVIILALLVLGLWLKLRPNKNEPPVLGRYIPLFGIAIQFNKDPKRVLLDGFSKFGQTASKVFGLKLASMNHFVISQPADIDLMIADNPYEAKFSLQGFLAAINFPLIVGQTNFITNIHTKLIATHLSNPDTVAQLGVSVSMSASRFIYEKIKPGEVQNFVPLLMDYINTVVSGCVIGKEVFESPKLLRIFARFNDHAIMAMGMSSFLPSLLKPLAGLSIKWDYYQARKILIPIIKQRREDLKSSKLGGSEKLKFLDLIIEAIDDDRRAADLIVITIWGGLTNLQATLTSTIMDIINADEADRTALTKDLQDLDAQYLNTFTDKPDPSNPWTRLRAAMFESIRLCGPVTGPARLVQEPVTLPSSVAANKPQKLPKGQAATLSAYYTQRSREFYGANAATWEPERFARKYPDVGSASFVSWGSKGPHMCPGRWFAQHAILIMTKELLGTYEIVPAKRLADDEKYVYGSAGVTRRDVKVTLKHR